MERRRHPRIVVHLPAVYRSVHRTMDTFVINLSQGGLALLGPQVDGVGTPCDVLISLPGETNQLELHGAIVWSDASIPCMGFRYAELNRAQRVMLANFLLARV